MYDSFRLAGVRPADERTVVIRRAAAVDQPALHGLAALDSAAPLTGEVLVAFVDDAPWAALSLDDDRLVADPFRPSAEAADLLRLRAAHLRAPAPGAPTSRRLLARLRLRRAIG